MRLWRSLPGIPYKLPTKWLLAGMDDRPTVQCTRDVRKIAFIANEEALMNLNHHVSNEHS
jgi:hypothetical protein